MSFGPDNVNFTGSNKVEFGCDWARTLTVKVNGVAQNMSAYAAVPPRCVFATRRKNADSSESTTAGCPVPVCAWLAGGAGGQYTVTSPKASSINSTVYKGEHDIVVTKTADGTVERIGEGEWEGSDNIAV